MDWSKDTEGFRSVLLSLGNVVHSDNWWREFISLLLHTEGNCQRVSQIQYLGCHSPQISSWSSMKSICNCRGMVLTLWRPLGFGDFWKKKHLKARGFAWEFLWSGMLYRPSKSLKRHGKSSSLHSKKIFFLGGCEFFVSDVISGELLGHLGPLCLALGANR